MSKEAKLSIHRDINLPLDEEQLIETGLEMTQPFMQLMMCYKGAMMEVETKFKVLNEQFSLQYDRQPISAIKSRLKNPLSIVRKLRRYQFPVSVESIEANLNDIAGVRVICSFKDDVYALARALSDQDDIEILRVKDYIANPKPNGYRSLHLIVAVPIFLKDEKKVMRAEIQFRTIAMDAWASLEHQLRYKKDMYFSEEMARELKACADLSAEVDQRMNHLQSIVLKEEDDKTYKDSI